MQFRSGWNNRVLIVDDQEEIHDDFEEILNPSLSDTSTDELAKSFLSEEDENFLPEFELFHARSGEEAYEIVKAGVESNRPIAVAHIDVRMPPGIDGIETTRKIRQIEKDIEIVIMTAYTDKSLSEIVRDMELLHKLLYIRKPFAREEIQQITLSLAEKWNVEQELGEKRRQLTHSNQRLEAVLDSTGDAIGMFDVTGRLLFANQWYEGLFDLSEDELKQMSAEELRACVNERFQIPDLRDSEKSSFSESRGDIVEAVTESRNPKRNLFYQSEAPVHDSRRKIIGKIIVYRDMSKELEIEQMRAEVIRLRTELETAYSYNGIVGKSNKIQEVFALMQQAAESNITVLIRGESGTGKELAAKSIHFNSRRKNGPFVAVDCAAIPETLIESELFGHERGAFTGASTRRIGKFESANGGTIFLDEIGEMQPTLQAKLLRVLQEREIQRVGGTTTIGIDIRVIAATNKDLEAAVSTGAFREDLFYRIAAFPMEIPPLRDRSEDVALLAEHFLKEHAANMGKFIGEISNEALQLLISHDWPGNVRELENAMERAVLMEKTAVLQTTSLPTRINPKTVSPQTEIIPLEEVEKQSLIHALEITDNSITKAANALGISRATIHRKLKQYRLIAEN
ncbi:MAG: sigma 54-interacting transcriptional regulator [Candidatus Poribacteria bacterium]|nr:sigma 54-interacting transcriptional regulator [Candidatus Poribacteria bacterium]MDE0502977.1 sigma 54-interacting transcriptional regulator [Candidatus Poribacteria bacterium]